MLRLILPALAAVLIADTAAAQSNAFGRPGAFGQGPIQGGAAPSGEMTTMNAPQAQTTAAPAQNPRLSPLPGMAYRGFNGVQQQQQPSGPTGQQARTQLPRGPLRPWVRYYGR